jgi:hypothetical protein
MSRIRSENRDPELSGQSVTADVLLRQEPDDEEEEDEEDEGDGKEDDDEDDLNDDGYSESAYPYLLVVKHEA